MSGSAAACAARHDHYPAGDAPRRARIRAAVADLDARWRRADAATGGLGAAIDAAADDAPEQAVARFLPWLADLRWLHRRLGDALALLAADPFARPPLRAVGGGDGSAGGVILAERGAVRLTLHIRPASAPPPTHALFVPGRSAIRVLAAGGASLCLHEVTVGAAEEAGGFTAARASACRSLVPRPLCDGEMLHLDTARQSYHLDGARGDVLLLELAVQPAARLPVRSYDLASRRLAGVGAAQQGASLRAMTLTLLRHLGRADAAPLFVAETQKGDFAARWHAMRELVALDPAAAHPYLAAMAAADPHAEVRAAAAATLALLKSPSPSGEGL